MIHRFYSLLGESLHSELDFDNLSVSLVGMDLSVCILPGKANCGERERREHYWIEWRYGKQLLVFQPSGRGERGQ